ncbi:hypothetical protein [Sphaerospermopsis torques-reginae]|jgi:hypothetical protein|uniref:Lipoprotein n=1 Tax=Sphaerospermopsis torques-reginae ITEP-024 TaxID=984208 RepID=A0ABX8X3D9_9CYAN|nr:hypothetical protein [Sphaerospermopsis torques-reginae]QYX33219.1 hypothetical protein K2F26_07815 [Sphaerospermopsis torques-reginae ITEP-024]
MKKLFCSILIVVLLCSCKGSGKLAGQVTKVVMAGVASAVGESLVKTGSEAIADSFSNQNKLSKQQALWKTANEINKSTPIQIDQETILNNVGVEGHRLVYNYELINYSSFEIDAQKFAYAILPVIENSICSIPETKLALQKGVSFAFCYFGNDSRFITKFIINPADCGY